MTKKLDVERVIHAIHIVTGSWLSGGEAELLTQMVGTREELLAHGIIDLNWLEYHSAANQHFSALVASAALPSEPLRGMAWIPSRAIECESDKEELLALVKQFSESPAEADPLKMLAQIASTIS